MSVIELSIVMPCLNEAETLGNCIRKAQSYLAKSRVSGEIVIGDNGSIDGSLEIARGLGAKVVKVSMRGYGAAVRGAVTAARGRYCVMADSDDSYDLEHLDDFVEKLREGYEIVIGNRFKGSIRKGAMPWKNRFIGNPVLSIIGKILFRTTVGDFHCGIRGFTKDAFERLDLGTIGMEFASEMVVKASLMGMKTTEVPTSLRPDGRSRRPHLRPYRDGWRHLRLMLLFSPNWLFLYPGLVAVSASLIVGGILLKRPVMLKHIELSLDTLVYCSALLISGFQATLFALLSRAYAMQVGLYPRSREFDSYPPVFTLERGLLLGVSMMLSGFGAAGYAIWKWKQHAFGHMVAEQLGRIVIPSSIAISMGVEVILFSFLLGTFGLNINHMPGTVEETDTETIGSDKC